MRIARPFPRALVLVAGTATIAFASCTPTADSPVAPVQRASPSLVASTSVMPGQRLLECSAVEEPAATDAVLGPQGGALRLGRSTVSVPAGALLAQQRFTLTETPGSLVAVEIHAVGRSGFRFQRPITVTVDYSRCGAVEGPLRAWYVDPETRQLLEDMGGVTDTVQRTHTFQTPHLSVYAMAN